MRFKLLIVTLVASLAVVSAAAGRAKPPGSGQGCKPAVTVMLAGVLAADVDPADGDTSFTMVVKRSNRFGRAYKQVRREGAHTLGALAPNDRLLVSAKACKADLRDGGMPDLTARKIAAHPARSQ